MNLFESSIARVTTPNNAVYMDAIQKLFNILFEDQMQGQQANDELRAKLCDATQKLLDDAQGARGDFLELSIKPEKIHKLADIINNQNSKSDAELFQSIVALVFGLKVVRNSITKQPELKVDTALSKKCIMYDAYSTSMDAFLTGASKARVARDAIQSYIEFKRDLMQFKTEIQSTFTPTAAPSMYTIDYTRQRQDGQYIDPNKFNVRGTINTTSQSSTDNTESDESPDLVDPTTGAIIQPTNGRTITGTIQTPPPDKTIRKGNKTVKPEKPKEKEPLPNVDFIDANVDVPRTAEDDERTDNSQFGGLRSIIMSGVDDADNVANYLQESWDTLLKTRGKLFKTTTGISIHAEPDENMVTIRSDLEGSNMDLLNRHMVAMYCLYMDAKKEGLVSRNETTITYPVAVCVSNDFYKNDGAILNNMCNLYDINSLLIVNKPSMNDLVQYLNKYSDNVDHEALAAAISQVIKNYSSSDLTKYTNLQDAINKSKGTTSEEASVSALNYQTEAFCNQVANVYQAMLGQHDDPQYADDDVESFFDEEYEDATDHSGFALTELKANNAYDYVMTFMLNHAGKSDAPNLIKPKNADDALDSESKAKNLSQNAYNQQAAQLLTYCRNDLRNQENAESQLVSEAPMTTEDDDWIDAVNDFSMDNNSAAGVNDIINRWKMAR